MYCQSIIFRNLKIMVLYTYQVSIYQGRIKRTSKKELLQKEFKRLNIRGHWIYLFYISTDQYSFTLLLTKKHLHLCHFSINSHLSLKEYTKYSKITSHSKATLENEIILPRACWQTCQCYTERAHSHQFVYVHIWDFFPLIV